MSSICDVHTCLTCRVQFKDTAIQREHYKTDWHRYNLKRKIADLPSVTAEEFNNKVIAQKNKVEQSVRNSVKYCKTCCKSFCTENSYINHLNSKKHLDGLCENINIDNKQNDLYDNTVEYQIDAEEVDSDEWDEEISGDCKLCLFCNHQSRSVTRNIRHMSSVHSFFIPDVEYCVDLPGLVSYLNEKVYAGFMCLWCNDSGKTFYSTDAAQTHMRDKGHCKMLHEGITLAEYVDYYDYSSSYPADEVTDKNTEEVSIPELDGTNFQLVLPSGAVIGHRSLMRYYKQNFDGSRAISVMPGAEKKMHKVLTHYRSMGWTVAEQQTVARRAKDVHYMRRVQNNWNLKLGIKANKLQKHFRPQVNY